MTKLFIWIGAVCAAGMAMPHAALAENTNTSAGAVLCVSPFSLEEAHTAASHGDEAWLKSLGCVRARAGISAIIIERNSLGWKVRLSLPNSDTGGLTVWGFGSSFTREDRPVYAPPPPIVAPPRTPIPTASGAPPSQSNSNDKVGMRVIGWKRDGGGAAVVSVSRIENKNAFSVENLKVDCTHSKPSSGEIIGRHSTLVTEIIGPSSTLEVHDIKTPFIVQDGTRVACRVEAFAHR